MKVQIIAIADRGVSNKERLHLRALTNTNLAFVMVIETQYSLSTTIVPGGRRAFWFPSKDVKIGDNVVLYSGPGTPSDARNLDGTTNHFFYWGLKETIWGSPTSAAVVFDVLDWQTSPYGVVTPQAQGFAGIGGLASLADILGKKSG